MRQRRRRRGFNDGFGVNSGLGRLWWRAGGRRGAQYGRKLAGEGHAAIGLAAHEPADFGAQAEEATQDIGILGGVQILAEIGVGGEEPILTQAGHLLARDLRHREGGQQGEPQEPEHRRNPGVQDRLRQGAQGVGFVRGGGLVWHSC